MKKKLIALPDDLKKAVMVEIQDYIDMLDEYDFDTRNEVGVIFDSKHAYGEFKYGDAIVNWEAGIAFRIETSYSVGDYLTPSSYDVEEFQATDIDLLYVSVESEEEYIEFEN